MTTKTILTVFLAVCCLVPSACKTGSYEPSAVDSRQFRDVVVPAGFRLRDRIHESFSTEEASWRHGHFVYSGGAQVDEAAAYVKLRMPHHSWKMVDGEPADDAAVHLRFERGIYSADYVFSRRDGITHMVVDYATDYARR